MGPETYIQNSTYKRIVERNENKFEKLNQKDRLRAICIKELF